MFGIDKLWGKTTRKDKTSTLFTITDASRYKRIGTPHGIESNTFIHNTHSPRDNLTSMAWPSSISKVTTQKQVTHFRKRSHGSKCASFSTRKSSSSSQPAMLSFSVICQRMHSIGSHDVISASGRKTETLQESVSFISQVRGPACLGLTTEYPALGTMSALCCFRSLFSSWVSKFKSAWAYG